MSDFIEPIRQFVHYSESLKGDEKGEAPVFCYSESLKGDEKGEAPVFCDRLFQAFGHGGYKTSPILVWVC
jgi:hypothetical protein